MRRGKGSLSGIARGQARGPSDEAQPPAEEAGAALREALRLDEAYPEAHNNLGNVLQKRGPLAEAVAHHRRALQLRAHFPEAVAGLASALADSGRLDEAIDRYREAAELPPASPAAHSALLFSLHYKHGDDPEVMAAGHARWARRHAAPLSPDSPRHDNDPTPGRRLRVGYLSPDFRAHPVSRFLEPVLEHRDRRGFETFLYADSAMWRESSLVAAAGARQRGSACTAVVTSAPGGRAGARTHPRPCRTTKPSGGRGGAGAAARGALQRRPRRPRPQRHRPPGDFSRGGR